jgi:hypothetical protein
MQLRSYDLSLELLVTCEYKQPKPTHCPATQGQLVVRKKAVQKVSVQYGMPVEILLQVTYRPGNSRSELSTAIEMPS